MFPIHEFDGLSLVFPANVVQFMPKRTDIPQTFLHSDLGRKYLRLFNDRFFCGLKSVHLRPREGVDKDKAWRHLNCVAGSYEPKHEHKEEAFAWLCDQWFEDIEWEPRDHA